MPRMQVHREDDFTVLGPCPGCEVWTVQFDRAEMAEHFPDRNDFHAFVETLLREHLAGCPGLQEIVANTP